MSETDLAAYRLTPDLVRSWLVERVADYLRCPAEEVDADAPLTEYGLDSVYAFALCGDIEETFGLTVEPTLLWEADSLAAVAAELVALAGK